MEPGLRRYWFEFDSQIDPDAPGELLDEAGNLIAEVAVRRGVGVTGESAPQCLRMIRARIFQGRPIPRPRLVIEDVDVSTLAEDVLLNLEPPVWAGIWFPRGFADPPTT